MNMLRIATKFATTLAAVALTIAAQAASSSNWKFDFGSGPVASGYIGVSASTGYNSTAGYGWASTSGLSAVDRGTADSLTRDYITGPTTGFKFSANVPNGYYNVTVITGDNSGTSDTSVKTEFDRIAVENVRTTAGNFSRYTFAINIRDGVMDLTFYGSAPKVNGVEIAGITETVLYIASDSTAADWQGPPDIGWAQDFTSYLQPSLVLGNYADPGETTESFWNSFYVPLVQPIIKAGDWLIVEFGHNDEKSLSIAQYQSWLQKYADDCKARGVHCLFVTPLERAIFSGSTLTWSHGGYPDAMKQVAANNGFPCLDLTTMSHNFWQSLGPAGCPPYFAPNDTTHLNHQGARRVGGFIRDGIMQLNLPIADSLRDVYQAEAATWSGGVVLEASNAGFDSYGYVNFPTTGGVCSFDRVNGHGGGATTLTFRFANGGTTARTGQLVVNGVTSSITFPTTGSWGNFTTMNVSTTLNSGTSNTIKLQSSGQDLANVDSTVSSTTGGGGGTTTYATFHNAATGLCIDGLGATTAGSDCGQWASSGSTNQQWALVASGSYVRLQNRATGLFLDGMGRTTNGSFAAQNSSSTSTTQQWIKTTSGTNVRFQNVATGLFLDGLGSTTNGASLGQWSSSTSSNQLWSQQ